MAQGVRALRVEQGVEGRAVVLDEPVREPVAQPSQRGLGGSG